MLIRSCKIRYVVLVTSYLGTFYVLSLLKMHTDISLVTSDGNFGATVNLSGLLRSSSSEHRIIGATGIRKVINNCIPKRHFKFPFCSSYFERLKKSWITDNCYKAVHGFIGSNCSILNYLSEVMNICPSQISEDETKSKTVKGIKINETHIQLKPLTLLKKTSANTLRWIHQRVLQTWPQWAYVGKMLKRKRYMRNRKKRKILIFPGSFAYQPWLLKDAGHGGPLGELVQWTDLIASLHLLGHDYDLAFSVQNMKRLLDVRDSNNCIVQRKESEIPYDLIFTDINGFILTGRELGQHVLDHYRCKIRVVDSFGTEAEYNFLEYSGPITGGKSFWGGLNILLPQFMTLFPHSPDNSFLGFAAGTNSKENLKKNDSALVYGKLGFYFRRWKEYLEVAHEFFEIHATALDPRGDVPNFIINHGPVEGWKVKELLKQSKIFLGLGFPYEGPGPLEAAAQGTIFINPKYSEPHGKGNTVFFNTKPTARKLPSQNPYMEEFIGEPYVYTIDVTNKTELRRIFKLIKDREKFSPYLPREFSPSGFTDRLHAYLEHQDFCSSGSIWPPYKNKKVFLGKVGQSCRETCKLKGLVCENTYFQSINEPNSFQRFGAHCSYTHMSNWTHAPSYDPEVSSCYLQSETLSFSCSAAYKRLARLCPCRDYIKGQVALAKGSL